MFDSATGLHVDNYFKWFLRISFCLFFFLMWQDCVFLCSFSKTQGICGSPRENNTTKRISVQKLSLTWRQISILNLYNKITISVLCMYKARINCNLGISARGVAPWTICVYHYLYSCSYSQSLLPFFTGVNALIYFYLKYFKIHILYFLVFTKNICKENISLEMYIRTLSCLSSVPRKLKPGNSNRTTGRSKLK